MRLIARHPLLRSAQLLSLLPLAAAAVYLLVHVGLLIHQRLRYPLLGLQPIEAVRGGGGTAGLPVVPPAVSRMNGQRISVEGEMTPEDEGLPGQVSRFTLYPDGIPHGLMFAVRMPADTWTTATGHVRVEGVLHVQSDGDDGYELELAADSVVALVDPPRWPYIVGGIFVPVFALLLAGDVLAARRGVVQGRCPVCGYDLRATPNRCPECGAVPPSR